MSKLDPQALRYAAYSSGTSWDSDDAARAAITAYRQAECKPFKDAPRDGSVIEAWHKRKKQWVYVHHNHGCWSLIGTNIYWGTEAGLKLFTFFRLPFNPEEG